jgi:sRNA-binding carbon storage regulator CsrA
MLMNISSKTFSINLNRINSQEPTTNILLAIRRALGSCRRMEKTVRTINMDMPMIVITAIIAVDSINQLHLGRESPKISICRKAINNTIKKELSKVAQHKTAKCLGRVPSQMY